MPDNRTRLDRALRTSAELVATDNKTAHTAFAKTNKQERIDEAQQTAEAARQEAQNAQGSAQQVADDIAETVRQIEAGEIKGYLNLTEYINEDKLDGQITGIYIADLAVSNAKIADLDVAKLNAGFFSAGEIQLTGNGAIRAGQTSLSSSGFKLRPVNSASQQPSENINYKLSSSTNNNNALWFFQTSALWGMNIRADGELGGRDSRIELITTKYGDSSLLSSCRLLLNSFGNDPGTIRASTDLNVERDVGVGRNLLVAGNLNADRLVPTLSITGARAPGNGGWVSSSLSSDIPFPRVTGRYRASPSGGWYDLFSYGSQMEVRRGFDEVRITNLSNETRDIEYQLWKE